CGSAASRAIRVLSPSTEPPVRTDDGSTASTPTVDPAPVRRRTRVSMNVDLPTPGTPEMPTRTVGLSTGAASSARRSRAASLWSARPLSTRVIARETSARRRARTPSTSAGTSYGTSVTQRRRQLAEQVHGGVGDHRAGREHRGRAHLLQSRYVVRWDHAADHDHDVVATELGQRVLQLGQQC